MTEGIRPGETAYVRHQPTLEDLVIAWVEEGGIMNGVQFFEKYGYHRTHPTDRLMEYGIGLALQRRALHTHPDTPPEISTNATD